MSSTRRLDHLAERKRLLVLQSDLHRALLQAQFADLSERVHGLSQVRDRARSASPWLIAGAAAMGMFGVWRGRKLTGLIPVALAGWKAWREFKGG